MEHALDCGKFIFHDVHAVLVGIPLMNDDRKIQLSCQLHLHAEGLQLQLPGDILVMIVQADLTDGLDLGI